MSSGVNLIAPFCGPRQRYQYVEAVFAALQAGCLGPGAVADEFRDKLLKYTGARYGVLYNSGTTALSAAAYAAGLQPGDEVLVPAYGVAATWNALANMGLRLRAVEIDLATGCMDVGALGAACTRRTAAICWVHFSGVITKGFLDAYEVARRYGLALLEDAACSLGHFDNLEGESHHAGLFGHAGILSFSVPKILTTGQGGMLLTNDASIAYRAQAFAYHGASRGAFAVADAEATRMYGGNWRLTDMQAAYGLAQLAELPDIQQAKGAAHAAMRKWLTGLLGPCGDGPPPLHNVLRTTSADGLPQALRAYGVEARRQYGVIHSHPRYSALGTPGQFRNAELWAKEALYLPFGAGLSEQQAEAIGQAVYNYFGYESQ